MKSTPGPWEFCGAGEIRSVKPVKTICHVEDGTEDSRVKADEYGANAVLLAAAPSMQKEILETMDRIDVLMKDISAGKYISTDSMLTMLGTIHMDLNRVAAIADGSWLRRGCEG